MSRNVDHPRLESIAGWNLGLPDIVDVGPYGDPAETEIVIGPAVEVGRKWLVLGMVFHGHSCVLE